MKNLTTEHKFNNKFQLPYPTENHKDNKVVIIPVTNNCENYENIKKSMPSIQLKPAFYYEDYTLTGLDNPAYFDAIKLRKEERTATKKKKFSTLGILPDQSSSTKLTKVPGLNIWRLDFSKGDQSTVRRHSTSSCYRFTVTIAMVVVLILLITSIAVLVHAVKGGLIFGIPWFPLENEEADTGVDKVAAHFRIMNRYFSPELLNTSSEAYNQLTSELKLSFDIVLMDSPLMNYYNTTDGFKFTVHKNLEAALLPPTFGVTVRTMDNPEKLAYTTSICICNLTQVLVNGSVVAECVIHLNRPVLEGAQNVGFAFLRALEKGKGILPPGRLYVDVHTVRFAALAKTVDENVLQDLQGLEPWSEWSTCYTDGVCDKKKMKVRQRKCLGSPVQLCSEDTEVTETKPCSCPTGTTSPLTFSRLWSEWSPWSSCPDENFCDSRNIQKRTRMCLIGPRIIPTFLCTKETGEVGTQIKHCPCTQQTRDEYFHENQREAD